MPVYVNSNVSGGDGSGSSLANATTTLFSGGALAKTASDGIYAVTSNHTEPALSAATVIAGGSTPATAVQIICVDPTSGLDVSDTKQVTLTSASGISLTTTGFVSLRGISPQMGTGTGVATFAAGTTATYCRIENSSLTLNNTGGGSVLGFSSTSASGGKLDLVNVKATFGSVSQSITLVSGAFSWRGGSVAGTVFPNALFVTSSSGKPGSGFLVEAVDLSVISGASKYLFSDIATVTTFDLKDCKLPAAANYGGVVSGSLAIASRVRLIRCSDPSGNLIEGVLAYEGTQMTSTAATLSGGAVDGGGTLRSLQIVPGANATLSGPLECAPIQIFNSVGGVAIAVTLRGLVSGSVLPNNDDIWFEVEYPADSGDALGAQISGGRKSILVANAAWAADSAASWTTPTGTWTAFKMTLQLTPAQAGTLTLRLKAAKQTTFYVDPKPVCAKVSDGSVINTVSKTFMGASGAYLNETTTVQTVTNTVTQLVPVPGRRSPR